jgi:Fe-S-cluster-containing hydrogenase component 2
MELEFSAIQFRKRRTVSADSNVCAGCRICELICSLSHEGSFDLSRSRIFVKSDPFRGFFTPVVCRQCSDVPCYYACPEFAIEIEQSFGTALINEEKCTGCRLCEGACPFKVIRFDQETKKAVKCDFCHGDQVCVRWCPVNALGITECGGGGGEI